MLILVLYHFPNQKVKVITSALFLFFSFFCLSKLAECWLGDISLSKQMQMFHSLASRYLHQQSSISLSWLTIYQHLSILANSRKLLRILDFNNPDAEKPYHPLRCPFVNVCQYISNQDLSKTMQDVHFLENTFLLSGFFGKFLLWAFQLPRVIMWGLSLYCCVSHRCYTAEQRLH